MFSVFVSDRIIQHCKKQVNEYNFGQRCVANGNIEQQLTGIIGQSVIMEMFGLGLVDGASGFDNGVDINYKGIKVDVKTMGRTTDVRDYYVNNFIGLQINFDTDVYIFCSFNKNTNKLTVCGWIKKSDFLERASFFPRGSFRKRSDGTTFRTFADLYEIANNRLNDVCSADELKNDLSKLK